MTEEPRRLATPAEAVVVLGVIAAILVVLALFTMLIWSYQVRWVANDRRHHAERLAEISACSKATDVAGCLAHMP